MSKKDPEVPKEYLGYWRKAKSINGQKSNSLKSSELFKIEQNGIKRSPMSSRGYENRYNHQLK